jgi:hypothetical protein
MAPGCFAPAKKKNPMAKLALNGKPALIWSRQERECDYCVPDVPLPAPDFTEPETDLPEPV